MDVFEAMETCIAMRYLRPDPVPRADLERLVYAATRASSPANSQLWSFIIVTDPALKSRLEEAVKAALGAASGFVPADRVDPSLAKMYASAGHLLENFARVPAWIVGCAPNAYPPNAPDEKYVYSAVYPAAQNLIVAARSMGLGTTFTTFSLIAESGFRETLGIPEEVRPCVAIAVGYPEKGFTRVKRKPIQDVIRWNGW
jgi:nitroreductase